MLWLAILLEHLEAAALPGGVRRKPKALGNDPVHFLPDDDLGERDLGLIPERRNRLVANLEQCAARDRVLVVLDFTLDEQLVFVAEGELRLKGNTLCGRLWIK